MFKPITESALIDSIRQLAYSRASTNLIVKEIGDDCAILRPGVNEDLVFTTDFALEGRHFERTTHSAAEIGHKALARSLSDLAAMGSEPVFCLVSLAYPRELGQRWMKSFYKGLLALATRYKITLAGGDLASFDKIIVDVMCCGRVPSGHSLLRSGAKPGDYIFVTGELGGSAHGLATRRGAAWQRHRRPEPRIEAGRKLRAIGVAAALDLSDGLSLDLARLCRESKVSADLSGSIPLAKGATLKQALDGGEDYELLFTAPPISKIPTRIANLPVTNIGTITSGNPGQVRLNGRPLKPAGFDHFR